MVVKGEYLRAFRDDLREPKVSFGRCCITGEWGKVVAIDLGDISINTSDEGPKVFNNQALFSKVGLEKLINYMDSQDNPIPTVTPELVYKWQVSYVDGSAISQFRINPETMEEEETCSKEINFSQVAQFSIVPRKEGLPTYTFVKETGKIYKNGVELDLNYKAPYIADSEIVYARKVNIVFGSVVQQNSLDRNIQASHSSVLQLIGWKAGGLHGSGPGCIIAIDERGHWRPYQYL